MKIKFVLMVSGILISSAAFCQDTISARSNKVTFKNQQQIHSRIKPAKKTNSDNNSNNQNHIRRDTRLGSSSPKYNTYKKNDYGAGAVTTDPHKGQSGSGVSTPVADSIKH